MTLLHGKGGSITWGGTANVVEGSVTKWSVNTTAEVQEYTNMTETWKVFLPGFKDWTATIETVWLGTDDALDDLGDDNSGSYYDCKLEMVDGTHSLNGNAVCTGVAAAVDKDDVVRFTYAFQGSGTLGYTG